ncbi:phosphoglycerate kinase [Candidatus Parcubacteria bacterium]|nr:phosphoglycerate kinase [Patescibacteria group bacterium]MCG2687132.1 phosphoglycerate kinase [Candidatus Parcubacteria bacterium]
MKIKSIKNIKNLKNKTILVRCDFDVPIKNNKIIDDARLLKLIPTIKFLLNKKIKQIILIGHLGRPGGKVVKELSLEVVKNKLEKIIKKQIKFISHGIPSPALREERGRDDSKIIMLENLRFNPAEEENNKKFAKKLASFADIYVNECFATSHRAHASFSAIQDLLPSYAGLNLENEIKNLNLNKIKKPLVLIIGGAKIETKLPVIHNFLNKADYILIGGAVANVFLKARGVDVGKSLVDEKYLLEAKKLLLKNKLKIILPIDYKISKNKILDIGPKTIILFSGIIKSAKTIIWNGPMGFFENKKFATGTDAIARAVLQNKKSKIIIGGGETITGIRNQKSGIRKNIFISTGGGAMLEFLAGKKLPGLKKII